MNIHHVNVKDHHHFFSAILISIVGILACSVFILYGALGSRASENTIPKIDSYLVSNTSNVVNQEGNKLITGQGSWIGTGASKTNATLGIYYEAVQLPANATITSAIFIINIKILIGRICDRYETILDGHIFFT